MVNATGSEDFLRTRTEIKNHRNNPVNSIKITLLRVRKERDFQGMRPAILSLKPSDVNLPQLEIIVKKLVTRCRFMMPERIFEMESHLVHESHLDTNWMHDERNF